MADKDELDNFLDAKPDTSIVKTVKGVDELDAFLGKDPHIQQASVSIPEIPEEELIPEKPEFEQNPFISFGKSIFNTVANQLPAAAAGTLLSQSDNLGSLSDALDEFLLPKLGLELTPEVKKQLDVKKEVRNSLLDFALKKRKKGAELSKDLIQSLSQIDLT